MYRFALSPRWVVAHVLVAALVVTMVSLGLWQLRRLDERRALNATLEARMDAATRDEEALLAADPSAGEWYRYELRGRFDGAREILVRGSIRDGLPGYEVLTPLVLESGEVVVVNRGFVPQALGDRWPAPEGRPAGDVVAVTGLGRAPEAGRVQAASAPGVAGVVSTIDLSALADLLPYQRLAPLWIAGEDGVVGGGGFPDRLPPPDLSEGPHLSYAVQWFLFTGIAAAGWPLLLRQSAARRRLRSAPSAPSEPAVAGSGWSPGVGSP